MNERALIKIAKLEERVNVLEGMVGLLEGKETKFHQAERRK